MQTVQVVECFNCLKLFGGRSEMQQVKQGLYFCKTCGSIKQLDRHIGIHPSIIVGFSALPLMLPAFVRMILTVPSLASAEIGVGSLILFGLAALMVRHGRKS